MEVDYDPVKRAWTLEHRELDFDDAPLVWAQAHFDFEDTRTDYGEIRICTVGSLRERMVMIVWIDRGAAPRRIISMRKCNDREQARYRRYLP